MPWFQRSQVCHKTITIYILLRTFASYTSGTGPIAVNGSPVDYGVDEAEALASRAQHMSTRSACLREIEAVMGRNTFHARTAAAARMQPHQYSAVQHPTLQYKT
jgi:hypothetical protein